MCLCARASRVAARRGVELGASILYRFLPHEILPRRSLSRRHIRVLFLLRQHLPYVHATVQLLVQLEVVLAVCDDLHSVTNERVGLVLERNVVRVLLLQVFLRINVDQRTSVTVTDTVTVTMNTGHTHTHTHTHTHMSPLRSFVLMYVCAMVTESFLTFFRMKR